MSFSNEQYYKSIESNECVKEAFEKIKNTCQELQQSTQCPDEDIDDFLKFLIGRWNK